MNRHMNRISTKKRISISGMSWTCGPCRSNSETSYLDIGVSQEIFVAVFDDLDHLSGVRLDDPADMDDPGLKIGIRQQRRDRDHETSRGTHHGLRNAAHQKHRFDGSG